MDSNRIDLIVSARDLATKTLKSIQSSIGGVTGDVIKAGIAFKAWDFGVRTLRAGFDVLKTSILNSADMEQQRIALNTLIGDMRMVDQVIQEVKQDAKTTPFELPGLIDMRKRLIAAGIEVDKSRGLLLALGDAISAVGGDQASMERLVYNMGQIRARGQASAQDFREFGTATIPITEMLAESMGKTGEQIQKMVTEGKIGFPEIANAIQEASNEGGRFFNAMKDQSLTFQGIMSNIKDTITIALTDFGQQSGLFDGMKGLAQMVLNLSSRFVYGIRVIATFTRGVIDFVKANKELILGLAKGALVVGTFVGSMFIIPRVAGLGALAIGGLIKFIQGLTTQMLVARISTGLLGVAIAGLSILIAKNFMQSMKLSGGVDGVTDSLSKLGRASKDPFTGITGGAKEATSATSELKMALAEARAEFEDQLAVIVTNARQRITENKSALEKELASFNESQNKKKTAHEEETERIKEETDQRLKDLDETMSKSVVVGSSSYDKDLENYRRVAEMIRQEGQKRLDQSALNFEKESEKEKAEYDERTNELRNKIKADEDMLRKHSETIKGIKTSESKDEITILKEQFEKRTQEIRKQYAKEIGMAQSASGQTADTWGDSFDEILEDFSNTMGEIGLEMPSLKKIFTGVIKDIKKMFTDLFDWISEKMNDSLKKNQEKFNKKIKDWESQPSWNMGKNGLPILPPKFAEWADSILPEKATGIDKVPYDMAVRVHKGERIVPADENNEFAQKKGVTINNYYNNTQVDLNALSNKLSFQLRNA